MASLNPPVTDKELALVQELHRRENEEIEKLFGHKYEPIEVKDAPLVQNWVALIRAHVAHELELALRREAALRSALDNAEDSK